jgi:two-component system LytT family response regulator
MGKLERQLDAEQFRRIHRSTIVNVQRIRAIEPWMRGDAFVVLADGQRLTASRNYRDRLREWIGS